MRSTPRQRTAPTQRGATLRIPRLPGLVLAAALLALAAAAFAAPGDPDATFDTDGRVTTDFDGGADVANAVAVQKDGKIVAAGSAVVGGQQRFALARYTRDGSPDTLFGSGGLVTTPFPGSEGSAANAVAVQKDGKIIAAGVVQAAVDNWDFALARYSANGTLDPSFDGDGLVTTDFAPVANFDSLEALLIQKDGRLVAAGEVHLGANGDFAVARYNRDGSPDTSFDGDGKLTVDFGGVDRARGVALQKGGRLVVAGPTVSEAPDFATEIALARLNRDGTLDPAFGTAGKAVSSFSGSLFDVGGLAIQKDGKILVGGAAAAPPVGSDLLVARYLKDGDLDTRFAGDGTATTDFGGVNETATALTLRKDGRIVAVGLTGDGADSSFAIARYNKNGTPDTGFGTAGEVVAFNLGQEAVASAVAVQKDGRIVVAGTNGILQFRDFALARLEGR